MLRHCDSADWEAQPKLTEEASRSLLEQAEFEIREVSPRFPRGSRSHEHHPFLLRIQSSTTLNSYVKSCRSAVPPFPVRDLMIPLRQARNSDVSWMSWSILLSLCVRLPPNKRGSCVSMGSRGICTLGYLEVRISSVRVLSRVFVLHSTR